MSTCMDRRWTVVITCVTLLLSAAGAASAQTATSAAPPPAQSAPKSTAQKPGGAGSAQFDALVKQATAARQAEQWEDAAALFTKAIKLRPDYAEGYWYQGAAYYQLDKFAECKESFRRVTKLSPTHGAASMNPPEAASSCAGTWRRQEAWSGAVAQPTRSATPTPRCSASAIALNLPLSAHHTSPWTAARAIRP